MCIKEEMERGIHAQGCFDFTEPVWPRGKVMQLACDMWWCVCLWKCACSSAFVYNLNSYVAHVSLDLFFDAHTHTHTMLHYLSAQTSCQNERDDV